ncbi:MAG: hypothetical protein FJ225_09365 [Lentisphaerae bacterium]|nr:hypothetical protein [Lentisphaerota bacterium]
MKKLLTVGMCLFFAVSALAAPLEAGTYEVRAGAAYNFESTAEPLYVPVMGGMGYYVMDGLQVGGFVTFEKRKWESAFGVGNVWGLGAFGEYVLDLGMDLPVMPSCALSVRALDSDLPRDIVFVLGFSPGLRCFVTESVALALQVDVNLAGDDIYNFERSWVDRHQPYPQDKITGEGSRVGYAVSAGVRVLY